MRRPQTEFQMWGNEKSTHKMRGAEEYISDICPLFDPGVLHSESLKSDLDAERRTKVPDASVLAEEPAEFSVSENNRTLPETRFYSMVGSARIEGFFHKGKSRRLYVMFDGSRTRKGGKELAPLPSFSRWSWYRDTDASLVSLEDPMFYTFPECTLGWFYGTKNEDYRECCAQCILKIADLLNIDKCEIILYGSSGGGTAAIGVSRYLPGCAVTAINPQLEPEKYPYFKDFEKITGISSESGQDPFYRSDTCRIIRENPETLYLLIENVRSDADYVTQMLPFCKKMGFEAPYGIEKHNNVVTWLYDAPGAPSVHSAVENTAIFRMIDLLIRYAGENADIEKIKRLYDVVNAFWNERYSLLRSNYYQKKKEEEFIAENRDLKKQTEEMRGQLEKGWIKAGLKINNCVRRMIGKIYCSGKRDCC